MWKRPCSRSGVVALVIDPFTNEWRAAIDREVVTFSEFQIKQGRAVQLFQVCEIQHRPQLAIGREPYEFLNIRQMSLK